MHGRLKTLLTAIALATCTAAQATDRLQSLVDETIRPLMAEYDIAGMAVAISHNGSVYRLQATKLGKLILTK